MAIKGVKELARGLADAEAYVAVERKRTEEFKDYSLFKSVKPIGTEKLSVSFGKTGRISFSGDVINKTGIEGENWFVEIKIHVEVGEIKRTRNVKLKSDETKTKTEKYAAKVTKKKRVAFVFNNNGVGCSLNKQKKGSQYYISAKNYCLGHNALKGFLKKASTFQHGAISFLRNEGDSLSENDVVIVNLMASGKNKRSSSSKSSGSGSKSNGSKN